MLYDKKWETKQVPVLEPHQQLLLDAAQYVRDHGWTRFRLEDPNNGRVCLVGAVYAASQPTNLDALTSLDAYDQAMGALRAELKKRSKFGLMRWNDSLVFFGETRVIRALERAAKR